MEARASKPAALGGEAEASGPQNAHERQEWVRRRVDEWRTTASPVAIEALELYTLGKVKLPAIPKVAAKLVPMLSRQNADISECVKLIEIDRVLAGAMLKCANSVAFFRGVSTTNVRDAVMRIGLKGSAALALSLSTTALYDQRVKRALKSIGSDFETEWRRSVFLAHASRDVAAVLGRGDAELAFTGGLFQNVGGSLAAFVIASLGLRDPEVRELPIEERQGLARSLRGILMAEYLVREALPDQVATVCLELDAPLEDPVDITTSVLRLTIALAVPEEADEESRAEWRDMGVAAATAMSLSKAQVADVRNVVEETQEKVRSFAGRLRVR